MLEDREKKNHSTKVQLKKTQQQLQKRLESLMQGQYRRQERSISECSTTTNSTTSSNSESGEYNERERERICYHSKKYICLQMQRGKFLTLLMHQWIKSNDLQLYISKQYWGIVYIPVK